MTTLNIQRTIKNPDDLASLVIDIYLDGISMVAEESGAHDVKKIIDRMSSDEKIVKALSGIIHTLAGDDLQTSFSLLNAVAKEIASIESGSVVEHHEIQTVQLDESNIVDFAQAIATAVRDGKDNIDFTDGSGNRTDMPVNVAQEALAKANEARESVGLAPVDAALPQATLH